MRFLVFFSSAMLLAGCSSAEDDVNGIPGGGQGGQGGQGGTPSTVACAAGQLFDAECDGPPDCCVPSVAPPFQGPFWVTIGAPGALNTCPEGTTEGWTAHAGLLPMEPHTCGACSCGPAACTFPEGIHTNAAKCADADGSITVPFGPDPAAAWEGVCSAEGALPADLQCGGVPCIQSLSLPALPVAACAPQVAPAEPFPEPTWERAARQCVPAPVPGETCPDGQTCVPGPPEGFTRCVLAEGEGPACPPSYPAQEILYKDVTDGRGCEPCACGEPDGAECSAILSAFSDGACDSLVVSVLITSAEPTCVDVVSGTALGSAEAWMVTDIAGSCAHGGGAPFGDLQPASPVTLCCQGDLTAPG
jgi:hypothetical protein